MEVARFVVEEMQMLSGDKLVELYGGVKFRLRESSSRALENGN